MSAERDQGLTALQSGDTTNAIALLEQAVQAEPEDYQAHLFLGAAYGQAQRHQDAIRTLTRAVELQPANAQARYNLGIALDHAGWPEQAQQALEQAITLQPDYQNAADALAKLRARASSPAQPAAPQPAAPEGGAPLTAQPAYQPQPTQAMPPQALYQPQPTQAMSPQPQGQQLPGYPPPGAPGPHPGYTSTVAGPAGYAPATPYGAAAYGGAAYNEDRFDIVQAVKDWWRIISSPRRFFAEQAGREGMGAPMSMFVLFGVVSLLTLLAQLAVGTLNTSGMPPAVIIPLAVLFVMGACLVGLFIGAGILHLIGRAFGNSAPYSGTFRALTYASAPLPVLGLIGALLTPMTASLTISSITPTRQGPSIIAVQDSIPPAPSYPATGSRLGTYQGASSSALFSNPVMLVYNFLGFCWFVALLGIGVANIQRISTAGAVVTVFLAVIIPILLIAVAAVFFAVALNAAASSMPHAKP